HSAKLLSIAQNEAVLYCGSLRELKIIGRFNYEDGLSERRELSIDEVYDFSLFQNLEYLDFYTDVFQIIMFRYKTKESVAVYTDSRGIALNLINRIELELSVKEEFEQENGTEKGQFPDGEKYYIHFVTNSNNVTVP
ncbi:MAG: hypothetical protein PVH64_05080, partial [Bacillota bacterium]